MQGFLIKIKRVLLEILITIASIAISIVCFILIALLTQKIQTSLIHKGDIRSGIFILSKLFIFGGMYIFCYVYGL